VNLQTLEALLTIDEFKELMASVLEVEPEEIASDALLADYACYDSVCALILMTRLEESAGVICLAQDLVEMKTIGDVEAFLVARGKLA